MFNTIALHVESSGVIEHPNCIALERARGAQARRQSVLRYTINYRHAVVDAMTEKKDCFETLGKKIAANPGGNCASSINTYNVFTVQLKRDGELHALLENTRN